MVQAGAPPSSQLRLNIYSNCISWPTAGKAGAITPIPAQYSKSELEELKSLATAQHDKENVYSLCACPTCGKLKSSFGRCDGFYRHVYRCGKR